jgi:hypothetical protein
VAVVAIGVCPRPVEEYAVSPPKALKSLSTLLKVVPAQLLVLLTPASEEIYVFLAAPIAVE